MSYRALQVACPEATSNKRWHTWLVVCHIIAQAMCNSLSQTTLQATNRLDNVKAAFQLFLRGSYIACVKL